MAIHGSWKGVYFMHFNARTYHDAKQYTDFGIKRHFGLIDSKPRGWHYLIGRLHQLFDIFPMYANVHMFCMRLSDDYFCFVHRNKLVSTHRNN